MAHTCNDPTQETNSWHSVGYDMMSWKPIENY